MMFFLVNCIYRFLIILNIFTNQIEAFETADLSVICGLMEGTKTVKTIPTGPTGCKSIACEMSKTTNEMLIDVINTKGNLTMVAIEDRYKLDTWIYAVQIGPKSYVTPLKNSGFNAVIFDYMYDEKKGYNNTNFTADLSKFFDDAKNDFPEMMFGMAFRDPFCLKFNNIDVQEMNNHVDLYLLKHNIYRNCESRDHQDQMPNMTTSYDISTTIDKLYDSGLATDKLILTIPIRIYSIYSISFYDVSSEDMSYSHICKTKMSKNRKFCYDTIGAFWEKGNLVVHHNLFGVHIQDIEFDDFDGSCGCTGPDGEVIPFKAISIVAQASQDTYYEKPIESFYCSDKDFPVITRP